MGFWPDGSKDNLPRPPIDMLTMVEDRRKHIDKVVLEKLRFYAAKDWITRLKPGTDGIIEVVEFVNGSRMFLGSYSQESASHEGTAWHAVHFDEPPPRKMWIAIRRGLLDFMANVWFTLTPLSCPWIYNELYQNADGERIAKFHLDLMDNPHISEEEKLDFIKDLNPEEVDARVHGKFSHLSGAIFSEFDSRLHVIPEMRPSPGAAHTCYMSVDPHDRRPWYVCWAAVNALGDMIIYDEWPNEDFQRIKTSNMSLRDYAALIRTKEGKIPIYERLGDPNFFATPSVMTGTTLLEECGNYGLDFYIDVNNDIATGHANIRSRLGNKKMGVKPKLFVCRNCINMIKSFEVYVWDEKDLQSESSARERPSEYGKDPIDSLRYLLDYEPKHIPQGRRGQTTEAASRGRTGYG